jgi:hypothetical protein
LTGPEPTPEADMGIRICRDGANVPMSGHAGSLALGSHNPAGELPVTGLTRRGDLRLHPLPHDGEWLRNVPDRCHPTRRAAIYILDPPYFDESATAKAVERGECRVDLIRSRSPIRFSGGLPRRPRSMSTQTKATSSDCKSVAKL